MLRRLLFACVLNRFSPSPYSLLPRRRLQRFSDWKKFMDELIADLMVRREGLGGPALQGASQRCSLPWGVLVLTRPCALAPACLPPL